jgi:hypothetical protein
MTRYDVARRTPVGVPPINGRATLTITQVADIKRDLGRLGIRPTARLHGLPPSTVQSIKDGRNWAWVSPSPPEA